MDNEQQWQDKQAGTKAIHQDVHSNYHSETWQHVLRCTQDDMKRVRSNAVRKLKDMMKSLQTMPELETILHRIVTKWIEGQALLLDDIPTVGDFILHQAYDDQNAIGVDAMFKGFMSKKWGEIQHQHYCNIRAGRKFNANRWKNKIQTFFVDLLHTIWIVRCTIVHAESTGSEETIYRNQMMALHEQTQSSEIHRFDKRIFSMCTKSQH